MIGRLLLRFVRWLGDAPAPLTLEQRIGVHADRLRARGYDAISALAAAEAVELGREYGLRFDSVEHDRDRLHWFGVYESGPSRRPTIVKLPLMHASEAEQTGVASVN